MIKYYVFLLLVIFFLFSCKSKKSITHVDEIEKTESAPPEDYIKIRDGFVLATVVDDFKSKGCPFVLKIEDNRRNQDYRFRQKYHYLKTYFGNLGKQMQNIR